MNLFSRFNLILVIGLIINLSPIVLFAQKTTSTELTVERIWKKFEFSAKGFPGFMGMQDGNHFSKIVQNQSGFQVVKIPYTNLNAVGEVIFSQTDLIYKGDTLEMDDYAFNSDESKILIFTNTESVYRRSYTSNFFIFDRKSKKLSALDPNRLASTLATFSPDGKQIAYVFENNIYVKNLENNQISAVSSDGKTNEIINGTTDWVYEEEFAITQGFAWSPDSKKIAYLKFDEREVKEFTMTYYGNLYPELYTWKYPKAGEDNSKISLHIATLGVNATEKLDLGEYEYIPRFQWSPNQNVLIVQTLNRHQNHVKYHRYEADKASIKSTVFFEEKSDTYVEIDDNLIILSDGKSLLRTSEASGFMHIYKVDFDGKNTQITSGNWDVIEFLGINEKKKLIYYTSAEKGAIHKGIYSIDLKGKTKKALSSETGSNSATFAAGMNYFVKYASNANTPPVISLCDASGKVLQVLEDNQKLVDKMKGLRIAPKEFIQIQGAEMLLNASIIKPADFDPNKKYPVYMHVYGGPGSNTVLNRFGGADYFYHQLLAQQGYVVVSVDPRGTMYQGEKFKKSTYLQLGKLETEDFVAVAKNLVKLGYVDENRIGIQGWSYGGFMASLAMTKGENTFKMGIAVAPVTNWRFYDNIYTERFMRTPQENPSGYDDNSPINFTKNITGKYFLIHGSGDDNVHYQNTMEMIQALTESNIQFDLFIYPNKDHGIYGGNTRNHLFQMLFDYTLKNL
jgi:dipeptidyl-peptidase-4